MAHQARNERDRPVLRCLLHRSTQSRTRKTKESMRGTLSAQSSRQAHESRMHHVQAAGGLPKVPWHHKRRITPVAHVHVHAPMDSQCKPAGWSGRLLPRRTFRGACQWARCQSCHSRHRNRTGGCLHVRERVTCCIPGTVHMMYGCGREVSQVSCIWARSTYSGSQGETLPQCARSIRHARWCLG